MPANGVIAAKLDLLLRYLQRVRKLVPSSIRELEENWERQKALERILQVMVEIVIDVADRLIALSQQPPAPTAASSLARLADLEIIANADRYQPMVRFRNFIVHRYEDVDLAVLYGILTGHLDDFDAFIREVHDHVERSG